MSDVLWKALVTFYRGSGFSNSAQIFEMLKDLPEDSQPSSQEEVREFLLTLPKPQALMELNGGEVK